MGSHLATAIADARAVHPEIEASDDEFARWVQARSPTASAPEHTADLLVACGCARGDAAALAVFETMLIPAVQAAIRGAGMSAADADDIQQQVRERILLAPTGGVAKIASYRGSGSLRGWVRVCAVRELLMHHRTKRETSESDMQVAERLVDDVDPELELIKKDASAAFRAAFALALAELPDRDKNVLRHHILDDLSSEQVAGLYGVHRVTATRWLAQARQHLLRETRRRLTLELRLDHQQFDSLMLLIESRLDVSFGGPLRR